MAQKQKKNVENDLLDDLDELNKWTSRDDY